MLRELSFRNAGPSRALTVGPLAPRFNLITGDNGLGKSFLLDAAWWALTRTWHEHPIAPTGDDAELGFSFDGDKRPVVEKARWDVRGQQWRRKAGRPPNPGLVIYARVDGSFSVWDPARNYRLYKRTDGGDAESPASYQFRSSSAVFEGLRRRVSESGVDREETLCQGLIDDWVRWQNQNAAEFKLLTQLLAHLGPEGGPLTPGAPIRPSLDDVREIPTIRMPYGQDVPITYAPAGVRRMSQLAYLLAWSLSQHRQEAKRIQQPLAHQIIVLLDEPETHLHPRWQRTVLPSLASAIETWLEGQKTEVQFLVATHSPLVLVSMEPGFDRERDALWKLELVLRSGASPGGEQLVTGDDGRADVAIERDRWEPRGDAQRWLLSDVFAMNATTAPEVERVLAAANRLLTTETPDAQEIEKVDEQLRRLLPGMDPFLFRWSALLERKKGDVR